MGAAGGSVRARQVPVRAGVRRTSVGNLRLLPCRWKDPEQQATSPGSAHRSLPAFSHLGAGPIFFFLQLAQLNVGRHKIHGFAS